MTWTTTTDRTTGYVVTAADWNIVEDDLAYLYGDTGWTTMSSFTNSWTAGQTVRYILLGRVVYLDGWVGSGTAATAAFTLPAGYRPSSNRAYTGAVGTTAANTVTIGTDGTVKPSTTANTWLSGISFPVV
jgi:hypothetical protein